MTGDPSSFVSLTSSPQRALAQPIVDLLKDNGIEASVKSDDCGGVDPALNFVNGTHVMVPLFELGRSRELLGAWEAAEPLVEDD